MSGGLPLHPPTSTTTASAAPAAALTASTTTANVNNNILNLNSNQQQHNFNYSNHRRDRSQSLSYPNKKAGVNSSVATVVTAEGGVLVVNKNINNSNLNRPPPPSPAPEGKLGSCVKKPPQISVKQQQPPIVISQKVAPSVGSRVLMPAPPPPPAPSTPPPSAKNIRRGDVVARRASASAALMSSPHIVPSHGVMVPTSQHLGGGGIIPLDYHVISKIASSGVSPHLVGVPGGYGPAGGLPGGPAGPFTASAIQDGVSLQRLGKGINLSVERFVTVGETIGESDGKEMLEACRETRRAGKLLEKLAESLAVQNGSVTSNLVTAILEDEMLGGVGDMNKKESSLIQASKALITSITKLSTDSVATL